jgi:hypothetical protein
LALILRLKSIRAVEPIEYGVEDNAKTNSVNADTVYPGGWYFFDNVMSFITFPSTIVNIDFTEYPPMTKASPWSLRTMTVEKSGCPSPFSTGSSRKMLKESLND